MGDADLYISSSSESPTAEVGSQWISHDVGDDRISLPTYLPDFDPRAKSITLFVGVRGRERGGGEGGAEVEPTHFELDVLVDDVEVGEVLSRGALRGGKRIMEGQAPSALDFQKDREVRENMSSVKEKETILKSGKNIHAAAVKTSNNAI